MKNWFFGLAMVAVSATAVQAATVTAVSVGLPGLSDFTITYTDTNGNNLLDMAEITATSGVTYFSTFYDVLTEVGYVAGISVSNAADPFSATFKFASINGQNALHAPASIWSFSVVPDLPAVPLPAGMPLLLAGVGALAALRRRRARG